MRRGCCREKSCSATFGDTIIIRVRERSTITSCGCGRSWKKIPRTLCTSARYIVQVTNSCRSRGIGDATPPKRLRCGDAHFVLIGRNRVTMGGIRLRTKFLLSMVAVSAALTFTTLLLVRHTVQQEVRLGIQRDLTNSVSAFHNFQKQREVTLERSAALLADLPNVRALMTTHDPATIEDPRRDLWQLAGSDLLLLADSSGKVMALQATPQEITVREGQDFFPLVVSREETRHWWYVEGHLYEEFLQEIYFGPPRG